MQTQQYQLLFFKEIRKEINETLIFINNFCHKNGITSLRNYFFYKSDQSQLYPDSLNHIMQAKLSAYYLVTNRAFMESYYYLHSDLREEIDRIYQFETKKQTVKQNKYLSLYLKKILNKNFYFEHYQMA